MPSRTLSQIANELEHEVVTLTINIVMLLARKSG